MSRQIMTARQWVTGALVSMLVIGTGLAVRTLRGGGQAAPAYPDPVAPPDINPALVMGPQACVECHKPAIAAWQLTSHFKGLDLLRTNPNALNYANALGIAPATITTDALCVRCHGTRVQGAAIKTVVGTSCESCHGPSGGSNGWLNPHGSYGGKDITRLMETPAHLKERFATCDKAGMVRPGREYFLAKACLDCHIVPFENLVNKTSHAPASGDFELVSWIQGEVCHDLFLDPKVNAEAPTLWMARTHNTPAERKRVLYVLGQAVTVEVALRNLANASGDNTYTQAMASTARSANSNVDLITSSVTLPGIQKAHEAFRKIQLRLRPSFKEDILKVAELFRQGSQEFARDNDGSKLQILDQLLSPTGKGTRYVPPQ